MTMEEKLVELRAQMKLDGFDAYVISKLIKIFEIILEKQKF
jgi:hypothetical protein